MLEFGLPAGGNSEWTVTIVGSGDTNNYGLDHLAGHVDYLFGSIDETYSFGIHDDVMRIRISPDFWGEITVMVSASIEVSTGTFRMDLFASTGEVASTLLSGLASGFDSNSILPVDPMALCEAIHPGSKPAFIKVIDTSDGGETILDTYSPPADGYDIRAAGYTTPLPLGVMIGAAGADPYTLGPLTDLVAHPSSGGSFTVSGVVAVSNSASEMSLYVTYDAVSTISKPYSVAIYQVSVEPIADPIRPPMRSKAGTVTGHFE